MVPVNLCSVDVWLTRVLRAAEASERYNASGGQWTVVTYVHESHVSLMDIFTQITLMARAPLYPVVAFNALPGVVVPGTVPGKHRTQEHPPCHQMRGGIRSRSLRTMGRTEVCRLSAGAER